MKNVAVIGRRLISVFLVLVVSLMLVIFPASAADSEAYFEFQTLPDQQPFTIKLTEPDKIQKARNILSGDERNEIHVLGRIRKTKAPYNSNWNYYLEPSTINFFTIAIEVCDASTQYTEDHLDEAGGAFLPGAFWCPWSSRLVKEVFK